ncbi:MAG: hypothetical protein Q4C78_02390 [Synergistaceae bacterium]|nr:hypothetical protein [Synergistaceae bacterium]
MADEVKKNIESNTLPKSKLARGKALLRSFVILACLAIFFVGFLYAATDADLGLKFIINKYLTPALSESDLSLKMDITGNLFKGYSVKNLAIKGKGNFVTLAEGKIDFTLRDLLTLRLAKLTTKNLVVDIPAINATFPSDPNSTMTADEIIKEVLFYINLPIAKLDATNTKIYFEDDIIAGNLLTLTHLTSFIDAKDSVHLDVKGRIKSYDLALNGAADDLGTSRAKIDSLVLSVTNNNRNIGHLVLSGKFPAKSSITAKTSNLDLKSIASIIPAVTQLDASGKLGGEFNFVFNSDDIKSFGNGTLTNGKIFGILANNIALDWGVNDEVIHVTVDRGEIFNSTLKGNFVYDSKKNKEHLKLNANIKNIKFDNLISFIKDTSNIDAKGLKGNISSLNANINGPLNALTGSIKASQSNISYNGLNLNKITIETNFNGTPVGKINFNALLENKKLGVQGQLSFKNGQNNLKYFADGLPVKKILNALVGDSYGFDGNIKINGTLKGTPDNLALEAKVATDRLKTNFYGDITKITADISANLSKEIYTIKNWSFSWQGAKFIAKGATDSQGRLNFRGESFGLKLSAFRETIENSTGLEADADVKLTWSVTGNRTSPIVNAKLTTSKGKLNGITISGINADIVYSDNAITLKNIKLAIDDGSFFLNAKIYLGNANQSLAFDCNGSANNFNIATIAQMLKLPYKLKGRVSGKISSARVAGGTNWKLHISSPNITLGRIPFKMINAEIYGTPKEIKVKKIAADIFDSDSVIFGKIFLPQGLTNIKNGKLDLTANCHDLNLYILALKLVPAIRGLQGYVTMKSHITGTLSNPQYTGDVAVEQAAYIHHPLPKGTMHFTGNAYRAVIAPVSVLLREGTVEAKAKLFVDSDNNWKYFAQLVGKDVPLDQFNIKITNNPYHNIRGIVNFRAGFHGEKNGVIARGNLTSNKITVYGIPITDIRFPIRLNKETLSAPNAKAKICGSEILYNYKLSITDDVYQVDLKTEDIDLAKISPIIFANKPEKISGKLQLEATATGKEGRLSTNTTNGILKLKDGEISGFEAIKSAYKFTGEKTIKFAAINIPFTYKSGDLTILPGTQAVAPDGNSLYNYASLDGVLTREGKINMSLQTKVNIKALNSVLDASSILLRQGVRKLTKDEDFDTGALLGGMLKSLIKGVSQREFRIIDMHIGGTVDNVKFSRLKMENTILKDINWEIPHSSHDPDAESMGLKGDTKVTFKYSIPLGPTTSTKKEKGGFLKDPFGTILDGLNFKF